MFCYARAEDDERAQKAYLHSDMRERERKKDVFSLCQSMLQKKRMSNDKSTSGATSSSSEDSLAKEMTESLLERKKEGKEEEEELSLIHI